MCIFYSKYNGGGAVVLMLRKNEGVGGKGEGKRRKLNHSLFYSFRILNNSFYVNAIILQKTHFVTCR